MKEKIIVAGAGHGGIVAAYYLAKEGYDVTVYERGKEGKLGHDQGDSIHLDGFEKSGIPVPEKWYVKRTPIAFCLPGTDLEPLVQADSADAYNVEIDRNALYEHLITLAAEAGAKFVYECEIIAPVILASRVVGIRTSMGDFYGGLIIDACGLDSPLRTQLPESFHIKNGYGKYDVLSAYRAYYKRVEGEETPALRYQVSLVPGEDCGLSWIVTNEDNVDILIGAFDSINQERIDKYLEIYRKENPHMGSELVRGGSVMDIPVRQPLSILVADGYAAIGDSAYMTVPIKGSGIGYSMRAGKMLADCVINDEDGFLNRESLWQYQVDFYKEIGNQAAILAIAKNAFPMLTVDVIDYAFREKIISSEDMELFGNEQGLLKVLLSLKISELTGKAKKVVTNPEIRKLLKSLAKNVTKYLIIDRAFPEEYDSEAIMKWADNYDSFFESIKFKAKDDTEKEEVKEEVNEERAG
ncbi:MAG: NAD(P)/FAD-dependent oxidoreductase [Acutalibacteraceae bacterium]